MTSPDGTSSFTYDATDQLTSADHSFQTDEGYTLRQQRQPHQHRLLHRRQQPPAVDGVFSYQYDAEGNRVSRTRISDGQVTQYEWDFRNRPDPRGHPGRLETTSPPMRGTLRHVQTAASASPSMPMAAGARARPLVYSGTSRCMFNRWRRADPPHFNGPRPTVPGPHDVGRPLALPATKAVREILDWAARP